MKGVINFEKLLTWQFFAVVAAFSAGLCMLGAWREKGFSLVLYLLLAMGNVVLLVMLLLGRGRTAAAPSAVQHEDELGVVADDMLPEFSVGVPAGNVDGRYFVAVPADDYGALSIFPARYHPASDTWLRNDREVLRKRLDSDLWMDGDKQEAACERAAVRALQRVENASRGTV